METVIFLKYSCIETFDFSIGVITVENSHKNIYE